MKYVWFSLAFLAGAVAVYAFVPSEPIVYREVIVPARQIIEREPDTIRTFIDRIRFVEVQPVQVAVAPGGALEQVQSFCRPTIVAQTDTVFAGETVDPMLLLRGVRYDRRWSVRRDRLFVSGPTSFGELKGFDYNVRGDWSAAVRGDGVLVEYPRTSFLYDVWEGTSQLVTVYQIIGFLARTLSN